MYIYMCVFFSCHMFFFLKTQTMTSLLHCLLYFPFIFFCCRALKQAPSPRPYIVYMGSSSSTGGGDDSSYLQMLSSLIPSEEKERTFLLNSYSHALKGFSAMLTESEASALSGYDEVVSVFLDPVLQLHTTRSWDFLEDADSELGSKFPYEKSSVDVIVGVIDTGIWPESPSFRDEHVGEIPSKWRGVCMEGADFSKSVCNRKLIGARVYPEQGFSTEQNKKASSHSRASPRDDDGHGTHTASIAGGASVANASYYGLARGTARGGLPSARVASYKACVLEGCAGSVILKAMDDAVKDGVDIISMSIGVGSFFQSDFVSDPIAIGAFHAQHMGVAVVCSGGNDGPEPYTVVNSAPWIFTVAASTIDRGFRTIISLGNNESYQGTSISFSPLTLWKKYPLAFGEEVAASFTPASDARNCIPGSLDLKKAEGKIIVCTNDEPNVSRRIKKLVVGDAKAKGMIIVDGQEASSSPFDSGTFPFAEVGGTVGSRILKYINSTKNPTATILPSTEVRSMKPAPVVASFSSRGPGDLTENILKPDIIAPGVAILAATVPKIEPFFGAPGNKSSAFGIKSGTSMACPHVAGAMAFVKSVHPQWSFSVIKSALMTTASMSNNMKRNLSNSSSVTYAANPHDAGSGELRPIKALDPGLAFETTTEDHLNFLCYYGYDKKTIRSIANTNFTCPTNSNEQLISNVNYPSISIGRLGQHEGTRKVRRVATNVGPGNSTYVATVYSPTGTGLSVTVRPTRIVYSKGRETASFRVFFDGKRASKGYNYGDIRWSDGSHVVRVVFAVNVV